MINEKKLIEELKENNFDILMTDADCFGLGKCTENVIELINKQPKVGEWIPCSERLPEEPLFEKGYIVQSEYIKEPFSAYWDGENWTDVYDEEIEVIAWQPLPNPFQKG